MSATSGAKSQRVAELLSREPGGSVAVEGWVKTARHAKDRSFLEVSDGSSVAGIQVIAEPSLANYADAVRGLRTGSALRASGELVESPGKGQQVEIAARDITPIGDAGDDYPLQKKRHSFEFLREIAHLRMRTNSLGAVMRVRNAASQAIHRFFQARGFVELHTPVITASDCEGAGEMFRVSSLPGGDGAEDGDFFGRPAYLTVSGQLEAEIGALALSRVYTFGPTFRAENSNTSRHLAEFWMIEPEAAFLDLDGNVELAGDFLRSVAGDLLEHCEDDLAFFAQRVEKSAVETLERLARDRFERISYTEAIEILRASGRDFEFPVEWGADLQSEHERFLSEEHVGRAVVVTDYPAAIKPFYMYLNDDERTVRAMDVLVPRVGEIIGGSQREHRLPILEARMRAQGLDLEEYWWYRDLRRYGSVPHAGFGLGFERLVQFATGMANIRDVIPFPRTPGNAEF